jgi:hypothetical protein
VGIEATGPIRWFERVLAELGHEHWIGDSAKIRASEVRKQKIDERDALLILDSLLAKRFSTFVVRPFLRVYTYIHEIVPAHRHFSRDLSRRCSN